MRRSWLIRRRQERFIAVILSRGMARVTTVTSGDDGETCAATFAGLSSLEAELTRMLVLVRRRFAHGGIWRRRPSVRVMLLPPLAWAKELHGLPATGKIALLRRVVATSAHRYFLFPEKPPLHTVVHRRPSGVVWGAAYDARVADAVVRACMTAGVRLSRVAADVSQLTASETMDASADDQRSPTADHLGGSDAASDLLAGSPPPLSLPVHSIVHQGGANARTLVLASVLALLVLASATLLPGLLMSRRAADARAQVSQAQDALASAVTHLTELRSIQAHLDELDRFAEQRRSMLSVLAALSDALPAQVHARSIALDMVGGTITVVGRDVASAAAALDRLPIIASASIVGAINREGGEMLPTESQSLDGTAASERAVVRLTFADLARRATSGGTRR